MTAGIFAKHGVWTGNCSGVQPWNPKGVFENHAIGEELRARHGLLVHANRIAKCVPKEGFRSAVTRVLFNERYAGGPWLFKMSAMYKKAWHEFEPYYVGVHRENNVESLMAKPGFIGAGPGERTLRAASERVVRNHAKIINNCEVIVETDEIIRGEYRTLERAFEFCGLEFDPEVAREFVDPELWHH